MKYWLMAAFFAGSGRVFAQAMSDSIDAPISEIPTVMNGFSEMLRWFVYGIILISVIGLFRMFQSKRRLNSKEQNEVPKFDAQGRPIPPAKKPRIWTPFIVILVMLAISLWFTYGGNRETVTKESYSNFMARVYNESIKEVQFTERDIIYTDSTQRKFSTTLPFEDARLVDSLLVRGIKVVTVKPAGWTSLLISLLPFILLIGFYFLIMSRMTGQNSKAFSFGKSKARLHEASKSRVTFKDVAGVDEAKEELQEIVEFLKDPKRFQRLGGRIPRGVLLVGRPGTGKTLLAKAVSGEAGVPFFSISGSDFVEMFVGVGAARVRDLFDQAKKNSPCITFIDEIDAVGRHRGTGLGGGHDEREQTLNQLLVEMDGFEPNEAVIIIAATNRPDILDPALLRPGRFDRQVTVDLPDIKGRTEILKVHAAKVPLGTDVHLEIIARGTPGFSGADLANLVNEAALIAASKNKSDIQMMDFEEAKDKLTLGKEKKSRVIPEDDKRLTAYHEIGHVLTSIFQDLVEPVHKVSIIPRGFTGGATHYLQSDKTGYSRSYLKQFLVSLLGGRAAEEVVFGELTTGAGNDLERTTDIAKKMVCAWGMSEVIGPMTIGKDQSEVFLGKELVSRDMYSEETTRLVDSEIRNIISEAHELARELLTKHRELLDILAKELQEKETLVTDEIFSLILAHLDSEERQLVEAKYDRAKEMRFEHSSETKEEEHKQEESGNDNETPNKEENTIDE
ncbi:MAG: ATP-dependent zinc metalloprotease FtsH [Candidatus Cloacimonetes bacterium]|jgi:cell division protease FtsH|nr:ATP-dependent zinc metalloprotease FtsH [Candidatus Cloacimonadota bacterium]MDD4231689.1 ATP-dependent zinc metalloprotease FtsH [Candidatus Cloacimonadota bacterium]MDY0298667.1 ATP-dependent zinc metalloprotease FtsH [Candidatus Cloacimonadaceae bacterium]